MRITSGLALALVIPLGLAACGGSGESATSTASESPISQTDDTSPTSNPDENNSSDQATQEIPSAPPLSQEAVSMLSALFPSTEIELSFWADGTGTLREVSQQVLQGSAELSAVADEWERVAKRSVALDEMNRKIRRGNFVPSPSDITNTFRYLSVEGPCAFVDLAMTLDELDPEASPSWTKKALELNDSWSIDVLLRDPWLCKVKFAKGYPKFYTRDQMERRQDQLTNWKAEGRLLTSVKQMFSDEIFVALDKRLYTSLKFGDLSYEPFWDNLREKPWNGTCAAMEEFRSKVQLGAAPMESLCAFSDFR